MRKIVTIRADRELGIPDKEISILINRTRCNLCGNKYHDVCLGYYEDSVWIWHLSYRGSLGQLEPIADRFGYRRLSAKQDPASYRKMTRYRRRVTTEKGMRECYPPYHRATVRLVCKCGGWRCIQVKTKLNPASIIQQDKPLYGV